MAFHKKEILELGQLIRAYTNRDHPVLAPDKQAEVLKDPAKLNMLIDIVSSVDPSGLRSAEACHDLLDKLEAALNDPDDTPDDI